jgi:hypothetical protein
LTVVNLIVYLNISIVFCNGFKNSPKWFLMSNRSYKCFINFDKVKYTYPPNCRKAALCFIFSSIVKCFQPVLKYLKDLLHYFQSVASVKFLVLKRFSKLFGPFFMKLLNFPDCLFFPSSMAKTDLKSPFEQSQQQTFHSSKITIDKCFETAAF